MSPRVTETDRPLVIGVGQPHRGDDTLGLDALERLTGSLPTDTIDATAHHGEGLALMALWEGRTRVLLLDAMDAGQPPGALIRMVAGDGLIRARSVRASSHAFGVVEAVETARALGRLPARLVLLGVQGADWRLGSPLSPPVLAALPALVVAARTTLAEMAASDPPPDPSE